MRWLSLSMLVLGCSAEPASGAHELYLYMVDLGAEPETGVELHFDPESSAQHPPGTEYAVGAFVCHPQIGMGETRAAVALLCSSGGASSNLRVTVPWRECGMTIEGSLIVGERSLEYWVRCEREPAARRRERNIEAVALAQWGGREASP